MAVGLLEFFILEASEHVDRLDGLVASAPSTGPDVEAFTRLARGLRGSATMAKVTGVADVAAALERAGRSLHGGAITWSPAVAAEMVAAVDDLKILLRGVRQWGPAEDERARARTASIAAFAPVTRAPAPTPSFATGGTSFMGTRAEEIATGVDALCAAPEAGAGELLHRVRTLRGVAAIKDLPPLADVLDGVERAAGRLEEPSAGAELSDAARAVLSAGSVVLRGLADAIRRGARVDPASPEVERFNRAAAALDDAPADGQPVVPVADLFFADGGDGVVARAPTPSSTPTQRFGVEVVAHAEHLGRLAAEAQRATGPADRERLERELRRALHVLRDVAESYGEHDVARFAAGIVGPAAPLEEDALATLARAATVLASPSTPVEDRVRRLRAMMGGSAAAAPAAAAGEPAGAPGGNGGPRTPASTPTGKELHALLQNSIAGISSLERGPLDDAAEDDIVPIESLLYRGRSALDRAREIRDRLRRIGGTQLPDPLVELFDLLDLAASE
jgi:chemotaxis protein histidine kinase CheA